MAAPTQLPVAVLPFAVSDRIADPHRYIVESPHRPGPQSAVVEVVSTGRKTIEIFDAFVVLPATTPPLEPITHPVYSACMRVIQKDYRALMSRASDDKTLVTLGKKVWTEPPFTSPVQQRLRDSAYAMIRSLHSGGSDLDEIIGALKERANWSPVHLQEKVSVAISEQHWRVLRLWERWESAKWDWEDRFKDFSGSGFGTMDRDEKKDGRESLRKRCEWLGFAKSKSRRKRRFERLK